jgi:hypothetical protein
MPRLDTAIFARRRSAGLRDFERQKQELDKNKSPARRLSLVGL